MRIVVISDTHGRTGVIDKILLSQREAKYVFFLGDNVRDIEDFEFFYPDKTFFAVSGNCDYNSFLPSTGVKSVAGINILYTHGHTLNVKYSTDYILKASRQNNCKLALYGHTHISKILYEDGVYIVNPGSASLSRNGSNSYAVVDITEKGIMPIIIDL
ncbi:MAG: metallophosphoesterase [Clostridia bacterium]|nr:metallophosphoesterase [Clostridia bacterium]